VLTQFIRSTGVSLAKALGQFEEWLIRNSLLDHSGPSPQARFCFATWTDWDLETMLEGQCGRIGLHKPDYFNSWIDLKASFLRRYKNSGRWKLDAAVRSLGLEWTGRAHSGLDDCINTANLLLRLLRDEGLVSPRKM
jgi:ERI1 exoribonuclease 2